MEKENFSKEEKNMNFYSKTLNSSDDDNILKDFEKINLLLESLFLTNIDTYDKFLLIYKIGNILRQNNYTNNMSILEIIQKHRKMFNKLKTTNTVTKEKFELDNFKSIL